MLEVAPVEIREADILIIHTGWRRYWEARSSRTSAVFLHASGRQELLEWMLKKKIKWFGVDCGSADHSMNTSIRLMRPDSIQPLFNSSRELSARIALWKETNRCYLNCYGRNGTVSSLNRSISEVLPFLCRGALVGRCKVGVAS